jgi:hypothetical protein
MFTLELTSAEYDLIINSRYVQRWEREVSFQQQLGYVSLIKPRGELVTLLAELGRPSRAHRFVNFSLKGN